MQQNDESLATDVPTKGSWSEDWERAEAAANEANSEGADNGDASEQKAVSTSDEGADDNGAEDTQSGSQEGGLESAGQAEGGEGEPDQRSQDGERGEESEQGLRRSSLQGRKQRGDGSPKSQSSVDPEKLEALKEQAKELGFTVEGDRVSVPDRVAFRAERRELKERLAQREQELVQQNNVLAQTLEERYGKAIAVQEALDSRDFDAVAEAAGYKDFGEMSVAAVQHRMSPEQRELMQMRADLKRERRDREAALRAQQGQAVEANRRAQIVEYKRDLQLDMQAHDDPAIADFAKEPSFVDMVYEVQERNWDPTTKQTVTTEIAAKAVIDELRGTYERMHPRFGDRAASQPEKQPSSGASAESQGRRPPTTVSQSEAADASAHETDDDLDPKAWERKWGAKIKESTISA